MFVLNQIYQILNACKHILLFTVFGSRHVCKKNPSCSVYFFRQIKENATIGGYFKAFIRILTCF